METCQSRIISPKLFFQLTSIIFPTETHCLVICQINSAFKAPKSWMLRQKKNKRKKKKNERKWLVIYSLFKEVQLLDRLCISKSRLLSPSAHSLFGSRTFSNCFSNPTDCFQKDPLSEGKAGATATHSGCNRAEAAQSCTQKNPS